MNDMASDRPAQHMESIPARRPHVVILGAGFGGLNAAQGLRNAPATFNRLVTHLLRPHRAYAPSYFDDIFVHSRAEGDLSAVEVHKRHLTAVLQCLRENSLYCNLKKCVFGAAEIPILGCFVSADGVRADPE